MIPGHGIMQLFPQSFDSIDPRMIGRLKQQTELAVNRKKTPSHGALVNHIVVQNQGNPAGPSIAFAQFGHQPNENFRILAMPFHPYHLARSRVQGTGKISFLILPRCRKRRLSAPSVPARRSTPRKASKPQPRKRNKSWRR